jgi:hypothetical protein
VALKSAHSPLIRIAKRYVRSIELHRDLEDPNALEGYVVTPSVRDATQRILSGLAASSTQRAFRVTGPYGSGKSAFALLLARLAAEGQRRDGPAWSLLRTSGIAAPHAPSYIPVPIVGRRANIGDALVDAVAAAASGDAGGWRASGIRKAAISLSQSRVKGQRDDTAVLTLLSEYARQSKCGILVLIDEFGRFLEYAALNRREIDPSFFQQLAELAGGTQAQSVAVVAFLHHRFSDYAAGLGEWAEAEWIRSAERYEDILFHDSTEQIAFMLANAIVHEPALSGAAATAARELFREAAKRGIFASDRSEMEKVATSLAPLHPASVTALANIARRFGQNERSVFGFLQSLEPFGFQRFIRKEDLKTGDWYRLADLYDYIAAQGGPRFKTADRERRWELLQNSLSQLADHDTAEVAVLKTIGVISVLEPIAGLRADTDTVAWCMGAVRKQVAAMIERLTARNLLYTRPHRQDFSLWTSTSVDLDGWLEEARLKMQPPKRLDAALKTLPAANPLVAHMHYHRTGTLRAFALLSWNGSEEMAPNFLAECDGAIVVVPKHPDENESDILRRIERSAASKDRLRLICIRAVGPADMAAAYDLATWRWIEENCKELRVDDLARREVRSRISAAEDALAAALRPFVSPSAAVGEMWLYEGKRLSIESKRELNRKLSEICDAAFPQTPVLKNELINRSLLSSATATARMNLLDAMTQFAGQPYLGMTGAPPERSIYLSMFHASKMHRQIEGRMAFAPPKPDPNNWLPAWRAIEALLNEQGACTFEEIVSHLALPPVGLRRGPALLLIAAFMLHHRNSVALLERNSFQPEVTGSHFMRLAKSPAHFSLRYLANSHSALDLLERLSNDLEIWRSTGKPQPILKEVVEAIYRWWATMPAYAKETANVCKTAKELRHVLRKASEPVDFLFKQLPEACGLPHLDLRRKDARGADELIENLNVAFQEIAEAPLHLHARARTSLLDAFDEPSVAALRATIRKDYERHRLLLSEYRLRTFVERASQPDIDDDAWFDGMASLLTGKRLHAWQDDTADEFTFESRAIALRLKRWFTHMRENIASETKIVSVHVVDTSGQERMVVVRPGTLAKDAAAKVALIRGILADAREPDVVLAHLIAGAAPTAAKKERTDG